MDALFLKLFVSDLIPSLSLTNDARRNPYPFLLWFSMMAATNTPTQAESLRHSLELAAGGISLHVNADKTEFMCFTQKVDTKKYPLDMCVCS